MPGWDDVSTPVAKPQPSSWDAVSSAVSAKPLDTQGIKQTATQNLQQPEEGEGEQDQTFGPKLDKAMGMPVTGALGKSDTDIQMSKPMRGHLMDAYANGTAHDAADFMQSAIPAASSVASPQVSDQGYWGKVKEAYESSNKQAVATLIAPFLPKQMQQDLIDQKLLEPDFKFEDKQHPTGPEFIQAFTQGERATVGRATGLLYAPVSSFLSPLVSPAIEATPGLAQKAGASPGWAQTIPPVLSTAMDFLGFGAGHIHEEIHPELQTLVGNKLGKPPEAVTGNDIASAIRSGFQDKAPKAQDFKDTAVTILGPAGETQGAATLREVYKETGVPPEKVFDDAKSNPAIAADIKDGKIPAAYADLWEEIPNLESSASVSGRPNMETRPGSSPGTQEPSLQTSERKPPEGDFATLATRPSTIEGPISPVDKSDMILSYHKINDVESLKRTAKETQPDFNKLLETVSKNTGAAFEGSDLKGEARLAEKLEKRKPQEISDFLRGRIIVDSAEQARQVMNQLDRYANVTHFDDFMHDEGRPNGYRAIHIQILGKSGLSAEVQIMPKSIRDVYDESHVNYQKWRNGIPKGEEAEYAAEDQRVKTLFDRAWARFDKSPPEFLSKPADFSPEHQEIEDKFGAPESMNTSQLGRLNNKLESIFSGKEQKGLPKAAELSDAQFNALEEYGRRVEAAQARLKTVQPAEEIRNVFKDQAGSLSLPQEVKDFGNEIKRDVLNFATPMATGSERAQAAAKDFANGVRFSQWNGARITNMLKEKFTPEELQKMWTAMDEASVHAQRLEAGGMSREDALLQTEKDNAWHFALPEEQKETIKALSDWAEHSWNEAKHLEMVKGEGLPFWTPRMAAVIGEDGEWRALNQGDKTPSLDIGANLRTTTGNLKGRKYLTAAETEAAMKEHFGDEQGEGVSLVRDIRAMPLAITRLQQAIAGRALVNEIKKMGKTTGADTTANGPGEGYFTLDHPALQTYRPKLELNEDGKWEIKKDEDGEPIFEKMPVYISKEFEGPLKAVLSQKSGATYQALMELKGKSMGLIMYSPLIHNAVEWGRALPAMPGKVATFRVYFEGNKLKNDPVQMEEAINAGLVPIGNRFFNQDISSILEQPNLTPGRSWTAKLLGGLVDQVSPAAGTKVKAAIDKMGDIWHNTLLWDRVADLQAGIYGNIRDSAIKDGMEPQAAQSYAAHVANRFAGALPAEAMGKLATKMANITMFSRSFTIGNLGVMKDMFKGLPSDVIAQLKRDVGEEGAKTAVSAGRRKAIAAFALDIGLMYAGNSILQDTFDKLKRDKTLDQIGQGYVNRFHKLLAKHAESPWELLNLPADLEALSSTSANEPGKENRILFSKDPKTNTAQYMRMPTGKIGEEFEGWLTEPNKMLHKKLSQIAGPLLDVFNNEDHFGHPVYDKDARGLSGAAENIGKVVTHLMEAQIPMDSVASAYHLLTGTSRNESLDYMKSLGPLVGVTFSKGYPGGPEAGILAGASRRHEAEISETLPKVKEAVEKGDEEKAHSLMDTLHMTPYEQRKIITHYRDPQSKVSARNLRKFNRFATPEEQEQLEEQRK